MLRDPLQCLCHAEVARPEPRLQLLPAKRRRHRRARLRTHGVHRGDRLAVAVLPVIDENSLALLLQPLGGDLARMAGLEQPRQLLRERVRLRERRTPCDRRDDVDAVGAARLDVARQLELVEQLPDEVRHLDRELETVVGRVEVEEHEVRPVRLVDARVPRVHVDAVVLHHEQHCFRRIDEREIDEPRLALPRPRAELARRDPARQMLRRLLLEERLAVDPVGIALHRERTILEMGNDRRPDLPVVLEEVALRDPVLGIEDTVRKAQLDGLRFSHWTFLTAKASTTYADSALASFRHSSGVPAATTRERPSRSSGADPNGGASKRSIASPRSRTRSCAAAMSTARAGLSEQTASTRPAAR